MKQVWFNEGGKRHMYRVGPLARLNCAGRIETSEAGKEFATFRELCGYPAHATVMQTYARLVEILYAAERARQLIEDDAILGDTRVSATFTGGRGVGHVEAPRGTLIHEYEIDSHGIIRSANLIVATQQNYTAINKAIEQAARSFVLGKGKDEALLNAIEFSIRCFDPCLSCATHAYGHMPLEVIFRQGAGEIRRIRR
jgi:F420-non-reducing hydrogenase large subunit